MKKLVKEANGDTDVNAAVKNALEMYQACDKEPRYCKLVGINDDGTEFTTEVDLRRKNTVAGIVRAIREGRVARVLSFR